MAAAADFGSLEAFLVAAGPKSNNAQQAAAADGLAARFAQGPTRQAQGKKATVAAPVPDMGMPLREDPFQDSANLNRKVAFKMLKQLGCQVQTVEVGEVGNAGHDGPAAPEAFIEVRQYIQPVLYQMLLEFGYSPFQHPESALAIRVSQPRQRARDEIFNALASRRPPRPLQQSAEATQGTRPRMSTEKEQDMIRRLSERKPTKAMETAVAQEQQHQQQQAKKYKSAAEQRAALQRLLRPRDARETDSSESTLLPSQSSASTSNLPSARTWPRPRARASSTGAEPKSSASVRPSPRLAQVGAFALQTRSSSRSASDSPDALLHGDAAQAPAIPCFAAAAEPGTPTMTAGKSDEKVDSAEDGALSEVLAPEVEAATAEVAASEPPAQHENADPSSAPPSEPEQSSRDWIDSVLGPLAWPGQPATKRTQSEQRERALRLARPRPPPLPQETQPAQVPAVKRSPRAQRDACSRLAMPRSQATSNQSEAPESAAVESVAGDGAAEPKVVVIPSMLSQFSAGLERIDEHAAPLGPGPVKSMGPDAHRQQRASSVPPLPYALPVVPGMAVCSGDSSGSSRKKTQNRTASQPRDADNKGVPSSLEQLLNDKDLVAEVIRDEIDENGVEGGEAMLAHIDQLYSSLLQQRVPADPALTSTNSASQPASGYIATAPVTSAAPGRSADARCGPPGTKRNAAAHSQASAGYAATGPAASTARTQSPASTQQDADDEDGQVLLANIDQLYNALIHGDSLNATAEVEDKAGYFPAAVEEDPAADLEMPAASGPELDQLGVVLEEVLWSALVLKRGTTDGLDVQASLLELLPPADLSQCFAACGWNSLSQSLLQRLSAELPGVHTALICLSPRLNRSCMQSIALLATKVREARDQLLMLASTSSMSTSPAVQVQPAAPIASSHTDNSTKGTEPGPRGPKPRRTSLSHWTSESLTAMEAPPRRLSQKSCK